MPQNPCVIATKTPSSDVLVFDYTKERFHTAYSELNGLKTYICICFYLPYYFDVVDFV